METGKQAFLEVKVSKKDGKQISEVVPVCVYSDAIVGCGKKDR